MTSSRQRPVAGPARGRKGSFKIRQVETQTDAEGVERFLQIDAHAAGRRAQPEQEVVRGKCLSVAAEIRVPVLGPRLPAGRDLGFPTRADRAANPGVAPAHCGRLPYRRGGRRRRSEDGGQRLPVYANDPLISPNATPPVTYSRLQGVTRMPRRARIEESDFCLTEPENWSVRRSCCGA